MKLSYVLANINSEPGLRSACSAIMYGATQRLLSTAAVVEGITRSITVLSEKFPDRAQRLRDSGRYQDAITRMDAAAKFAATVHGVVEARFPLEPEFMPAEFRMPTEADLKQAAEFADMTPEQVIASQIAESERQYQQQLLAKDLASAAFYAADADEDCEVKADTVMGALQRMREKMVKWSLTANTLASLGLLRDDIKRFEPLVEAEANQPTHTGFEQQEAENEALSAAQAEASAKRDAKRSEKPKRGKKEKAHA